MYLLLTVLCTMYYMATISVVSQVCLLFFLFLDGCSEGQKTDDNINGEYKIRENMHYADKHTLTWGENGEMVLSNLITLSTETAIYNCTNTGTYKCEDTEGWMYDWNKLFGKGRCGYLHDHHKDSDRFVWRRCSDSSCSAYDGANDKIQIAGYSYDDSLKPYEHPELLPIFASTIFPNVQYQYTLTQDASGVTSYNLKGTDSMGDIDETIIVQHNNLCDDYEKGTLQGFYFGGTCRAPTILMVQYKSC